MKILSERAGFAEAQHLPRLRLILSCFSVLLTLAVPASALPPAAEQKLTKLAPESLFIPLENGGGVANVILVVAAGASVPSFKVTSAVGSSNAIPSDQFKFECQAEPKANPNDRHLAELSTAPRCKSQRRANNKKRRTYENLFKISHRNE